MYQKKQHIAAVKTRRMSYSAVVDIWSLGVVVCGFMGPPIYKKECMGGGTLWGQKIVGKFKENFRKRLNELQRLLLGTIVILSSNLRCSASACYNQAVLLPDAARDDYQL